MAIKHKHMFYSGLLIAILAGSINVYATGLHGRINHSLNTSDISSTGRIKADNPVWEQFLNTMYNSCGLLALSSHNVKQNELTEIDLAAYCTAAIGDVPGGSLSATVAVERWMYISTSSSDDTAVKLVLDYIGPVQVRLEWTQRLIRGVKISDEGRFRPRIGKIFTMYEGTDSKLSLVPTVEAAILNNYYGDSGPVHVTPGLKLNMVKRNISICLSAYQQFGLRDRKDVTYGGISLGVMF